MSAYHNWKVYVSICNGLWISLEGLIWITDHEVAFRAVRSHGQRRSHAALLQNVTLVARKNHKSMYYHIHSLFRTSFMMRSSKSSSDLRLASSKDRMVEATLTVFTAFSTTHLWKCPLETARYVDLYAIILEYSLSALETIGTCAN